MHVVLLERLVRNAHLRGARAHVREGRIHALAHDVAELARDGEASRARHAQRFDDQEIAASRRPCEARDDADLRHHVHFLHGVARHAEHGLDLLDVDHPRALLTVRFLARPLAHDRREIALEVAKPCLARVTVGDEGQRFVSKLNVLVADPMLHEQARQQIPPRDLDLFLDRVAGDANDLHPVAQGRWNVEQTVCGADEQRSAQVEGQIQVVIDEFVVLAGIEHLEHCRRWITARSAAGHLVDLIDHQHGVAYLHASERLQEQSGHCAHVRAPVSANLGLVAHASHGDAVELAPDRRGDGFTKRRLAGARRADEAQDGSVRIATAQLAHREILDDPLLGLAEAIVPVVERLFNLLQRDLIVAAAEIPRQRENPVEIRADHLVFARGGAELPQPLRFSARLLAHALGQLRLVDLAQQLHRFLLARVRFAELGLNRAQLLPQVELALMLLDLDFRLPLHVFHHPRARHLALEPAEDEAQPLPDVEALQNLVLVGDAEVHVRGGQIREAARIRDIHLQDGRHFVGNPVHELGECFRGGDDARDEVGKFCGVRGRLLRRPNGRDRIRLLLVDPLNHDAPQPLQRDLNGVARKVDPLVHARRNANAADEPLRVDRILMVTARHHERDHEARLVERPQQREILRGAHLHGDRSEWIDDGRAQCHERQGGRQLGFENLVSALWFGHLRRK